MKLLILGHHRSGSTSLLDAFSQSINNCKGFYEPLKEGNNNKDCILAHLKELEDLTTNIVVKSLISLPFYNEYQNIKFYKKYIKNFDKVILLLRKDIKSLAESLDHLRFLQLQGKDNQTHDPYFYSSEDNIELSYFTVQTLHKPLITFSNLTKLPIVYYEDIFSGDKNYLKYMLKIYDIKIDNFKIFCEHLDPKHRYRQI